MMLSEVTQLERVKPQIFVKKDEIKCYRMGCAGCLKGPLRVLKSPIKPTKSFRMSSVRHIFILCEVPPHPLSIPDIHRQLLRIVRYIRERLYHFAESCVSGLNLVSVCRVFWCQFGFRVLWCQSGESQLVLPFQHLASRPSQDFRPQYFSAQMIIYSYDHDQDIYKHVGGDLTTSIFLLEVVGFMLPIDVYSRFDPRSHHTLAAMRREVLERMVSQVMVWRHFWQSYLYGAGCFAQNSRAIAI